MQPTDGGPVKIGTAADVEARHRQLEKHYRKPLAILATIEGGREEERQLHERFSHLRFGRTEQFRPAPELMEFIGRPLLVGANPDAIEAMVSVGGNPPSLTIRASPEWREWIEQAAAHCRTTTSGLVDVAVADYARGRGFTNPPPKR